MLSATAISAILTTLILSSDYIIAGGGSAGLIVADKLSEAGKKVLVLEMGGPSTASSGGKLPIAWSSDAELTPFDVPALSGSIFSQRREFCTNTAGTAGCTLGGGSSVNALVFVPPPTSDFNNWPQGWKGSDLQSSASNLYVRNPRNTRPSADGNLYDTGVFDVLGGFLHDTMGFTEVDPLEDPDSKDKVFSHPPLSVATGERAGPVRSYLPASLARDNYAIALHSSVVQVLRNGTDSSVVTGVVVNNTLTGEICTIAVKEGGRVVLAAGAFNTPRVLLNSGIGRPAVLSGMTESAALKLVKESDRIDLPVGENFKDHPVVTLTLDTTDTLPAFNFSSLSTTSANQTETSLYLDSRSGSLAWNTQRLTFWTALPAQSSIDKTQRHVQGTAGHGKSNQIAVKVYLTHGLTSVGALNVSADGSKTGYAIDPLLVSEGDKAAMAGFLDVLIAGVGKIDNLRVTAAQSGKAGVDLITSRVSGSHFVGSAKLGSDDGRKENGTSVVDLETKVYGTSNLFVVDASIHPDLPTGNSQAIVMVVAEQAAKRILGCSGRAASASSRPRIRAEQRIRSRFFKSLA